MNDFKTRVMKACLLVQRSQILLITLLLAASPTFAGEGEKFTADSSVVTLEPDVGSSSEQKTDAIGKELLVVPQLLNGTETGNNEMAHQPVNLNADPIVEITLRIPQSLLPAVIAAVNGQVPSNPPSTQDETKELRKEMEKLKKTLRASEAEQRKYREEFENKIQQHSKILKLNNNTIERVLEILKRAVPPPPEDWSKLNMWSPQQSAFGVSSQVPSS